MQSAEKTVLPADEMFDRRLCRLAIETCRLAAAADELLLNPAHFENELAAQIARVEQQVAWFRQNGLAHQIDWHKEQLIPINKG